MARTKIKTISLVQPLEQGDGPPVDELELHTITARDMEGVIFPLTVDVCIKLLSAATGRPVGVLEDLSPPDVLMIVQEMNELFTGGRVTGSK